MSINVNCVSGVNFRAKKPTVKHIESVEKAMREFEAKQFGKPMQENDVQQKVKHPKLKKFEQKVWKFIELHFILPDA